MAISFPTPNLGDPSTLTTTQAGITWTWNDTLQVWSSEAGSVSGGASVSVGENPPSGASQGDLWWNDSVDSYRLFIYTGTEWVDASPQGQEGSGGGLTEAEGDARYLSALSDDTAAGAITFESLTTHEAGVSVTGGTDTPPEIGLASSGVGLSLYTGNQSLDLYRQGYKLIGFGGQSVSASFFNCATLTLKDSVGIASAEKNSFSGININADQANFGTIQTLTGFSFNFPRNAGSTVGPSTSIKAFNCSPNSTTNEEDSSTVYYGFYSDLKLSSNYNFYAAGTAPNYFGGLIDQAVQSSGSALRINGSNGSKNFRVGADGHVITIPTYNNTSTNSTNYIRVTSAGTLQRSTSSRRYKDNIRDCTLFDGTASASVKQLQPRMWEDHDSGETVCGFVAEELYELGGEHMVSFAPWSWETSEDRQYRTGNGAAPVTRDAVPMSDEVEVVDGISDRSLTILLTKALQEALARIEELESNTLQPLYATEADLPSASEHHGKTAHVHATGSLYFAHAGNWVKLQNA